VVETNPPHNITTVELTQDAYEAGLYEIKKSISKFEECMKTGYWYGYTKNTVQVKLPMWYSIQIEEEKLNEQWD
jgi:hypothetical protein